MKLVIISGTPGTGKTTVSNKISELVDVNVITLNELAISEGLIHDFDKKRETNIVDIDKLVSHVLKLIEELKKKGTQLLIIESHFSDIIPNNMINYAIVLRCEPDVLCDRLEKRGYSEEKVAENIQAEILGNCANFLIKKDLEIPLLEIVTSNLDVNSVAKTILDIIHDHINMEQYRIGKIDWLETLFQENRLEKFFN
jgi:adenylate kinase